MAWARLSPIDWQDDYLSVPNLGAWERLDTDLTLFTAASGTVSMVEPLGIRATEFSIYSASSGRCALCVDDSGPDIYVLRTNGKKDLTFRNEARAEIGYPGVFLASAYSSQHSILFLFENMLALFDPDGYIAASAPYREFGGVHYESFAMRDGVLSFLDGRGSLRSLDLSTIPPKWAHRQ